MGQNKILVTGAFGQIGSELVPALQQKHGKDNVIAVGHNSIPTDFDGIVEKAVLPDKDNLRNLVEKHNVSVIYHLVSLLSVKGEKDPQHTWNLNMSSLIDVLDLAAEKKIQKIFWPSSIAAFGPTTPRQNTPQNTILVPTTMYGVTKVSGELLANYYNKKFDVDIRSVRYPGIISYKQEPGGGTTDYAVAVFYEGLKTGRFTSFVNEETILPMMYIDDAIRGTIELMEADSNKLSVRTSYNLAAISFSAKQLVGSVLKYIPDLKVSYNPDHRQKIADSWPQSIDDSQARKDWGWQHHFDLEKMTEAMIQGVKIKLGK